MSNNDQQNKDKKADGADAGKSPRSFKAKLSAILKAHAHEGEGRSYSRKPGKRTIATGTVSKRWGVNFKSFEELRRELGYKLEDPQNFRLKHMQALVVHWESLNLSPSTIQNKISILRVFAKWIDKDGMVPATVKLVSVPEKGSRSYCATHDKTWTGAGFDPGEIIRRVREADPRVAMQLELQLAFGLRSEESWKLQPRNHTQEWANGLWALEARDGTKGKRPRLIPIRDDRQRDVLQRSAEMAGRGSMIPRGMRADQWRNHYYYILRKLGITRKELGIVPHGARHQYANERYEAEMGIESPVKGGGEPDLDPDEYIRRKRKLSEELGHSRHSIVGAYTGTKRSVKKAKLDWTLKQPAQSAEQTANPAEISPSSATENQQTQASSQQDKTAQQPLSSQPQSQSSPASDQESDQASEHNPLQTKASNQAPPSATERQTANQPAPAESNRAGEGNTQSAEPARDGTIPQVIQTGNPSDAG